MQRRVFSDLSRASRSLLAISCRSANLAELASMLVLRIPLSLPIRPLSFLSSFTVTSAVLSRSSLLMGSYILSLSLRTQGTSLSCIAWRVRTSQRMLFTSPGRTGKGRLGRSSCVFVWMAQGSWGVTSLSRRWRAWGLSGMSPRATSIGRMGRWSEYSAPFRVGCLPCSPLRNSPSLTGVRLL